MPKNYFVNQTNFFGDEISCARMFHNIQIVYEMSLWCRALSLEDKIIAQYFDSSILSTRS